MYPNYIICTTIELTMDRKVIIVDKSFKESHIQTIPTDAQLTPFVVMLKSNDREVCPQSFEGRKLDSNF